MSNPRNPIDPRDPMLTEADRADRLAAGYREHARSLIEQANEEESRARAIRMAVARTKSNPRDPSLPHGIHREGDGDTVALIAGASVPRDPAIVATEFEQISVEQINELRAEFGLRPVEAPCSCEFTHGDNPRCLAHPPENAPRLVSQETFAEEACFAPSAKDPSHTGWFCCFQKGHWGQHSWTASGRNRAAVLQRKAQPQPKGDVGKQLIRAEVERINASIADYELILDEVKERGDRVQAHPAKRWLSALYERKQRLQRELGEVV